MSHLACKCDCGRIIHFPKGATDGYLWVCSTCGETWRLSTQEKNTVYANGKKSEEIQINSRNKPLLDGSETLLYLAKENIIKGDLEAAINNLCKFTSQSENKYYYIIALQLQSRYSSFIKIKLSGILSSQEEILQFNKISIDTITLIEEILKSKDK
jgi:hypothetical protein